MIKEGEQEIKDPRTPDKEEEDVTAPLTRLQEIEEMYSPVNKRRTVNGRGGHTGSPRNSWT